MADAQTQFSGTRPVAPQHAFDVARLAAFMRQHVQGFEGELAVEQFKGGQSNPTFLLTAGRQRYVLRRKPPGTLLPSAHAVEREYRVIKALAATEVPVARALALCARAAQVAALRSPGSASLVPRERDLHEAALLERRRCGREGGSPSAQLSALTLAQLCRQAAQRPSRAHSVLTRDSRRSQAHLGGVSVGSRSTGAPLRERRRRELDAAFVLAVMATIRRLATV